MSSGPPPAGASPPPTGSSLPAYLFILCVACGVGGVLLVFVPGWLFVFAALAISIALQYLIWGRWLRNAIQAEEAAEAELRDEPDRKENRSSAAD